MTLKRLKVKERIGIYIGEEMKGNNHITVQTRKRKNIRNTVFDKISSSYVQHIYSKYKTEFPNIKYRSKETANYNCFGMVFASRRCFVIDDIGKILIDDNYSEVHLDKVLPGDIILYFSNHEIIHCGIVIEELNSENCWNPLVVSKWHCFSEVIHRLNECPYAKSTTGKKYYRIYE